MASTTDLKRFIDTPPPRRQNRNSPPPMSVRGPRQYRERPRYLKTKVAAALLALFFASEAIHYADKNPIGNGLLDVPAKIGSLLAHSHDQEVCVDSSYTQDMRVASTSLPEAPNASMSGQKITTRIVTVGNIYKYCTNSQSVWRNGNNINMGIILVPNKNKISMIQQANTALGGKNPPTPVNPSQMAQLLSLEQGAKDQANTQRVFKASGNMLGNSMVSGSDVSQAASLTLMDYIAGSSNGNLPNASPDEYGWAVVTFPQPVATTKPAATKQ